MTDKLRSYGVAQRELIPDTIHDTSQYANNRAELSHQSTGVRERGMRKFKSIVSNARLCVPKKCSGLKWKELWEFSRLGMCVL